MRIPDTNAHGPLQRLTRAVEYVSAVKELREADEEFERVKPEVDRWINELQKVTQEILAEFKAIEDSDKSDVDKVKERRDAANERLKEQHLGTPRDVRAGILRQSTVLTYATA